MNTMQQQFFDFTMARVYESRAEDARAILMECMEMMDAGTFDMNVAYSKGPIILNCIKPEYHAEFQQTAMGFISGL